MNDSYCPLNKLDQSECLAIVHNGMIGKKTNAARQLLTTVKNRLVWQVMIWACFAAAPETLAVTESNMHSTVYQVF